MNSFMYKTNGDGMYASSMMMNMNDSMSFEYQYLAQMKSFINKAYKMGKYCDLTLKTKDGVALQAHKLILASQCKYFMQKLDAEPDANELVITEVKSGDALKVVVDYIYTQRIKGDSITSKNAKEVLNAGDIFKIEDIKEEAAIVMAKNLDEEIAVDVMTNNIFAGAVSNNAFAYTANNFQLFLSKEHLKKRIITEIKPDMLCHLLSQKNLMLWDKHGLYLDAVEREKQLFFFVMSYVAHDVEARLGDLKSILTCLKLPLLIHAKILSVNLMGAGLKKPPEVLAGMLSEILDPFDKLEGGTNLATMFASSKNSKKTGLSQSQRRAMADTCKMRYATLPHTCLCSDVARTEEPWAEKITFCPVGNESRQVRYSSGKVLRSVTVCTANTSVKEGAKADDSNQFDRRVSGVKLHYEDGSEESLGECGHHTAREVTHGLEEGEVITEVHTHYPASLLGKKGTSFHSDIFSLTSIYDLSFVTSKETGASRTLGPMAESDLPLADGLTLKIPTKLKHLEKNCPGNFYWLQGFGMEDVKIPDKDGKMSIFPIWGFKAHFKVYPVKKQEFEFVPGFKKHYQFSIDGLMENPVIDELEDLLQLEKPPVHEVVDLDEEESEESDSENEEGGMVSGTMSGHNEDSIMVVDSDDDNEDDSGDEGGYRPGVAPPGFSGRGGGVDEPIEIESSSEEEEEKETTLNTSEVKEMEEEKKSKEDESEMKTAAEKRKRQESEDDDESQDASKKSSKQTD